MRFQFEAGAKGKNQKIYKLIDSLVFHKSLYYNLKRVGLFAL